MPAWWNWQTRQIQVLVLRSEGSSPSVGIDYLHIVIVINEIKIDSLYSENDLLRLTRQQFHQKWFNEALTDRQMAKLYNTTVKVVKQKRKELGLNWFNSAFLYICGGTQYKDNRKNKK